MKLPWQALPKEYNIRLRQPGASLALWKTSGKMFLHPIGGELGVTLDARPPHEGAMGFDHLLRRNSRGVFQRVHFLGGALVKQVLLRPSRDEGLCDGWSKLARVQEFSEGVERLGISVEEAYVKDSLRVREV